MSEERGNDGRAPNKPTVGMNGFEHDRDGLSLLGDAGREVAENVARIALGSLSVADLGDPRYGLAPDGALSIEIDRSSFEAVSRIVNR
jgi:hypothetical protein